MTLPAALAAALDEIGRSASLADLQAASHAMTQGYRAGEASHLAVNAQASAAAYAAVRMPATYAAVAEVLGRLAATFPDFSPTTLTDVGAGPGTASFAALDRWPLLAAVTMIEPHPALAAVARQVAASLPTIAATSLTHEARRAETSALPPADLVIAAYVAVEQRDTELAGFTARLIGAARQALVLVEPGTPEGYRRLMLMRAQALAAGLHVAAPCPHDGECPLLVPPAQAAPEGRAPGGMRPAGDWCHFSVRVQRSRLHRQVKQVELGHEDEKFAYVVLTHAVPSTRPPRILSPPVATKIATTLKLCAGDGVAMRQVPARDKAASRAIRRLDWGDALPE